ncbi:hypothetical protein HDZ31DRAFT_48002, partial [Schizophyllum fasciatum]
MSSGQRTGIIAGATAGGIVLILIVLGGIFVYRRRKRRMAGFFENLVRRRREGKGAGGVGLLDDEFDDDDRVVMGQYRDQPPSHPYIPPATYVPGAPQPGSRGLPSAANGLPSASPLPSVGNGLPETTGTGSPRPSVSGARYNMAAAAGSTPSVLPTRVASDSGSIFHEEGVWPPPGANGTRFVDPLASGGALGNIVDDVMGPRDR